MSDTLDLARALAEERDLRFDASGMRPNRSLWARVVDTLTSQRPYVVELPQGGNADELRELLDDTAARMRGIALLTLLSRRWEFAELDTGQRLMVSEAATRLAVSQEEFMSEMIAAWVAGDGQDLQRVALADGIRAGRWRPGACERCGVVATSDDHACATGAEVAS